MEQGVGVAGIYVRDQDEAIDFYVGKLGFGIHTDARNGDYRWLTVRHPDQPGFQLGLFRPQPPTVDEATATSLCATSCTSRLAGLVRRSLVKATTSRGQNWLYYKGSQGWRDELCAIPPVARIPHLSV